jgi:GT2 family glycosyltransferase
MKSSSDIVILLNDDILLESIQIDLLCARFEDPSVFAVTFQSLDEIGQFREGAKRLVWKLGFPTILHNPKDQLKQHGSYQRSAYAVGGHCAFRKSYFAELKGFDSFYDPFYWEDVDLAMRARERGWVTIYASECRVIHALEGAIRTHSDVRSIREITLRNRLLFAKRHCPARLRPLLALNIRLRQLQSGLTGDHLFPAARAAAEARWISYKEQTCFPNSTGVTHGE